MSSLSRLKKRHEFVKVARQGVSISSTTLIVQSLFYDVSSAHGCRVGFTASKRVGNAVRRNRAKRRMRAVVQLWVKKGMGLLYPCDLTLVAKPAAVTAPFQKIQRDFEESLASLQDMR